MSTPPVPPHDEPQHDGTVPLGKPHVPQSGEPAPPHTQPGPGQSGTVPPPNQRAAAPGPVGYGQPGWPGHPGQPQQGFGAPGQPPYGAPPQPGYRAAVSPSEERLWATLSHLAGPVAVLISVGTLGWAAPLVIFLVYKDRSPFVRQQAAEALNFQITLFIAYAVVFVITVLTLFLGAFLFLVPLVVSIVFGIIAAVATNRGESYRYPLNIRLVS